MIPYEASVEQEMRKFFNTLSEKDKRRYAAVETNKLGRGGIAYIVQVLGCSRKTVKQGIKELKRLPLDIQYDPRIRQLEAGRKPYDEVYPEKSIQILTRSFWMSCTTILLVTQCRKTFSGLT